jgi:tripartite-type tricarboxylate transporter receptor subunit TctC
VPFAAGGPADLVARTIAQQLGQRWGQSVVVDNKPGANTVIGATDVVRARPDGYTLLQPLDATLTTNGFLLSTPPYDSLLDFTHIIVLVSLPLILVTPEKLQLKTVADLVAYAKQQPDGLTYAYVTPGVQVLTEQFAKKAGLKVRAIPYKSTADVVKAILSGEVDFSFDGGAPYLAHIESGRVRVLATTGTRRPVAFARVPTLREAGVDLPPVTAWHGLSAPKGLPDAVRLKIEKDVREVLALPDVREKLISAGLEVEGQGQAEFVNMVRRDMDRIGPAIKELGIRIN